MALKRLDARDARQLGPVEGTRPDADELRLVKESPRFVRMIHRFAVSSQSSAVTSVDSTAFS